MLYGRQAETGLVDELLEAAKAGASSVLVVRGEPGIGKSALLDYAAARAGDGMRVLRGVGIETEAELPFAALHLLLRSGMNRLDRLPDVQATALRAAFGLVPAAREDRFLAGLATLTLLAELADEGPLLCLVDDAQWVDQASAEAILFAGRRLQAEGIVLLLAVRDGSPWLPTTGLPELRLGGLDPQASRALLRSVAPTIDAQLREQAIAETGGNPLALVELPKAVAGSGAGALTAGGLPLTRRVQEAFAAQIDLLPEPARRLLLLAAAEGTGDLGLVLRAGETLGVPAEALHAAEKAGLVTAAHGRLSFRHPLIRAATYHAAGYAQRRAAHQALANAIDPGWDASRRAWHLAATAIDPDEGIAAQLEQSGELARSRGAFAAMAAAYERAAQLSPDKGIRAGRLATAAQAAADIGHLDRAADLSGQAAAQTDDPMVLARIAVTRAQVESGNGTVLAATRLLIDGAMAIVAQAPQFAAEMLAAAAHNAWNSGDPALIVEAATRLSELDLPADNPLIPFIPAMYGLGKVLSGDLAAGYPHLKRFAEDLPGMTLDSVAGQIWASQLLFVAGDCARAAELDVVMAAGCRANGQVGLLATALDHVAYSQALLGRHRLATASAIEGLRIAEDTGQSHVATHLRSMLAWLAAVEGDEERCRSLAAEAIRYAEDHESPAGALNATWALALLDLGHGRFDAALDRMARRWRGWSHLSSRSVADEVEAAVRIGRTENVAEPLARFEEWAASSGQLWAKAMVARCQALLSPDDEAEPFYLEALRLHAGADQPYEQARTALAYGEWLRRQRRKVEARTQLRHAHEAFDRLDAGPWAERARAELRATGDTESRRERGTTPASSLTAQELQVVRLAATGASNRDIAAQLFLSPRTVGQHLYKAFPKLGVASRTELAHLELG